MIKTMKTTCTTLIVILISACFVSAQDTTWTDSKHKECAPDQAKYYRLEVEKGDLTSFTDYYVSNNQIWSTGQYLAGKKQGKFQFFYENGQKATEFVCINGKIEGVYTNWHENGAVREKGSYKGGLQTGLWTEHDEDGNLVMEENIEEDADWGADEDSPTLKEDGSGHTEPDVLPVPETYPVPKNLEKVIAAVGYPKKALKKGMEGKVVARVLVSETGAYEGHKLVREADPILNKAVEKQLKKLEFTPGSQAGKATKMWLTIPFEFELGDETDGEIK